MNNELYHYGVLGMKWGVRRYQNRDGTLTDAGRKKYLNSDGTLNKKGEKARRSWSRNLDANWVQAYNKATYRFNDEIDRINKKYEGYKFDKNFSSKEAKAYLKEVSQMWKKEYENAAISIFGNNEITKGKNYVENLPFYSSYDI